MKLSEARKATAAAVASDPDEALLPCAYCPELTPRKTLTALGARCQRCYAQFLQLGYSGSEPPRQHQRAAWVAEAAKHVRRIPNQFTALAERMRQRHAQQAAPRNLADDDVNALLQEERQ